VTTSGPSLADQVTKLYEIIAGYHTSHLIEIGRDLGVWEYLVANPGAASEQAATSLDLEPFYVEVLCKTAYGAGLVDSRGDGWEMAPHMDLLLGTPGNTFDFSRAARAHIAFAEDYAVYPEAFRSGSSMSYQSHDATFMDEVAHALRPLPLVFLEAVLPELPEVGEALDSASRILDVGCGGGWAVVALAEAYTDAVVVGVEIEPVSVGMATRLVEERGLAERCSIVLGDASGFSSNESFDLATMFLVYHEIAPEIKRDVLRSIFDTLVPGGILVMFDEVYPEEQEELRRMPTRFAALAQWYELIWGNVIGTRTEVMADFEATGFDVIREHSFSRFHVMVARRPSDA